MVGQMNIFDYSQEAEDLETLPVKNRWGQGGNYFSVADAIADLMHDLEELREKGVL